MRTILLLLLSSGIACAQEFPYNSDGLVVYERVFDYENLTKSEIHKYSRLWVDDLFSKSSEVIQSDLPDDGELTGSGYSKSYLTHVMRISMIPNDYIGYKFSVSSRDGKSRVRFYAIELTDEYLKGIAIEPIDRSYRAKKNEKTVSAWVNRVSELNKVFDDLLQSYNNSIHKYAKDKF